MLDARLNVAPLFLEVFSQGTVRAHAATRDVQSVFIQALGRQLDQTPQDALFWPLTVFSSGNM